MSWVLDMSLGITKARSPRTKQGLEFSSYKTKSSNKKIHYTFNYWLKKSYRHFFSSYQFVSVKHQISRWFTNSNSKNEKVHFELQTRIRKIESFTCVFNLKFKNTNFHFELVIQKYVNENFHYELLTPSWKIKTFTLS